MQNKVLPEPPACAGVCFPTRPANERTGRDRSTTLGAHPTDSVGKWELVSPELQCIQAGDGTDALPKVVIDFFGGIFLSPMDPGGNGNRQQVAHDVNEVFLTCLFQLGRNTDQRAHVFEIPPMILGQGIQPVAFFQCGKQFCMFHNGLEKRVKDGFPGSLLGQFPDKTGKKLVHLPKQHIYRGIEETVKSAAADRGCPLDGRNGKLVGLLLERARTLWAISSALFLARGSFAI